MPEHPRLHTLSLLEFPDPPGGARPPRALLPDPHPPPPGGAGGALQGAVLLVRPRGSGEVTAVATSHPVKVSACGVLMCSICLCPIPSVCVWRPVCLCGVLSVCMWRPVRLQGFLLGGQRAAPVRDDDHCPRNDPEPPLPCRPVRDCLSRLTPPAICVPFSLPSRIF